MTCYREAVEFVIENIILSILWNKLAWVITRGVINTSIRIGIGSFWVSIQYIDTGSAYCDTYERNFNN